MSTHPDCQARGPHSNHTLLGPGGNKPGTQCDGEAGPIVLGGVGDARDALNLRDMAAVWERVASGQLIATREADRPGWTISESPAGAA